MTLIHHGFERLAAFDTRDGGNVMRHQNSVLHGILQQVPWGEFDRLVAEHEADARVRRLTTESQLQDLCSLPIFLRAPVRTTVGLPQMIGSFANAVLAIGSNFLRTLGHAHLRD